MDCRDNRQHRIRHQQVAPFYSGAVARIYSGVDTETIQKIIAIDLTGPMLIARHVGAGMVARGRGVIVNTASQLAFHGSATRAAYAAAKAGLVQFTKSAAAEWAPHGAR